MAIPLTSRTGNVGSQIPTHRRADDIEVWALTRSPEKARLPSGVAAVRGDLANDGAVAIADDITASPHSSARAPTAPS